MCRRSIFLALLLGLALNSIASVYEELKSRQKTGEELPKNPESMYPEATKADLKRLCGELVRLEKSAREMPSAMGVTEGTVADTSVHLRGSHKKVHIHDLHATLLYLLGLDHERPTYRYGGRDFRLTDVHGRIVQDIMA
jgi:hypothetical protein